MIAEAEDSPVRNNDRDNTMENNSAEWTEDSFTDDEESFANISAEQKKINKQRKTIQRVKMNIGQFFNDN